MKKVFIESKIVKLQKKISERKQFLEKNSKISSNLKSFVPSLAKHSRKNWKLVPDLKK
jgi:hypothetical protein